MNGTTTMNIHHIKSIEIKPIDSAEGTHWRTIKFVDEYDHEHSVTLFPKDNDTVYLKIKVSAPVSYEI